MLFFKVLEQIFLPSSFVLILIMAGLIFFFLKKRKLGKTLLILGILFYYLFSITPVSNFLLSPLERKYSSLGLEDIRAADKIVLLLGGRETDILRANEVLRIYYLQLTNYGSQPKIIISGTDPLLPTSQEALGLKKFFVSRGIKEEDIIIESRSRTTWENARNVRKVVGESSFFLVTSAYHMKRATGEFEKVGTKPIPAPTDFKIKTGKYTLLDFFPEPQNLRNSNLALHEYFGILWYSFGY